MDRIGAFFKELRRRRVFRVAALYVIGAWVVLQVADLAFPGLGIPDWAIRYVWIGAFLGFPIALIFGWRFDIIGGHLIHTPDSEAGVPDLSLRRTDYMILAALAVVVSAITFGLVKEIKEVQAPNVALVDAVEIDPKSIAVMSFENMSADPEQEYFSDGISEELLNLLAQIPELTVISRSSAFSFKGEDIPIPMVAAQLGVAHVLEGSVRRVGNRVRITAQLIEAQSDSHLWSESYDRELDDIFAVQDEIATAVVDALKITLLGNEPRATETNPEAYSLYLQGRYFANQGTEASYKQAETLLKQALAIDSGFAPVWTELASVFLDQSGYNFRPHDDGYELARNAAQQALLIDPNYARGYASLARIERQYDWNFAAAYEHMQQALKFDSGDVDVLRDAADLHTRLGRLDEAIDLYRQSIAVDPVSSTPHLNLGRALYYAGRLDEAAVSLRKALSLTPGIIRGHYFLGWVLLAQGDARGALVAMAQEAGIYYRLTGMAVVQHALGNAEASNAALEELIEKRKVESAYQIALAYAYRRDINTSFDWLQYAYDVRDSGLNKMMVDPLLANLHDDPRWVPFLDKIGLPH